MNDVMQGRWTLLHVIGLVVWQKHVKNLSLSLSAIQECFFDDATDPMSDADRRRKCMSRLKRLPNPRHLAPVDLEALLARSRLPALSALLIGSVASSKRHS